MSRRHDNRRAARRRHHNANRAESHGELLSENQILPLLWRPWYLNRLSRVEGVAWFWPLIQAHCELEDPEPFPEIPHPWSDDEIASMTRYLEICEHLVDSSFLNQDATVEVDLFTNKVTKQIRPPDDATVGFAARFRQLFNSHERASFADVRNTLANGARATGVDDAFTALKTWKKAHQTLRTNHVRRLMHVVAQRRGLIPESKPPPTRGLLTFEEWTPEELIGVYLLGDLLHWGKGRDDLARWQTDEAQAATMDNEMRKDAAMLAHFYVGFAGVVRQSLPAQSLAA